MATKKISALDAATIPLDGTEEVELVQGGASRRAAVSALGVGLTESNLWPPPSTPHALDLEFGSTTIPAGWAWSTMPSGSAVDPYAVHASGGPRIAVHTEMRRSWIMAQPPSDSSSHHLHRTVTIPTNFLFWARMSFNTRGNTGPANNDMTIGIVISATVAGIPDGNDRVAMFLNEADSGVIQANSQINEGGVPQINDTTTDLYGISMQGQPLEYVAIHKVGTTYHLWTGTANGSWINMGQRVYAGAAVDRVSLILQNASGAPPGTPIMGCDFMRFKESATLLP